MVGLSGIRDCAVATGRFAMKSLLHAKRLGTFVPTHHTFVEMASFRPLKGKWGDSEQLPRPNRSCCQIRTCGNCSLSPIYVPLIPPAPLYRRAESPSGDWCPHVACLVLAPSVTRRFEMTMMVEEDTLLNPSSYPVEL